LSPPPRCRSAAGVTASRYPVADDLEPPVARPLLSAAAHERLRRGRRGMAGVHLAPTFTCKRLSPGYRCVAELAPRFATFASSPRCITSNERSKTSSGFQKSAQQEVFQTRKGLTLYFHPEVLRELFREGEPVLRHSGSAEDDADLPSSAAIRTHIYMRDVLRCFRGMSWTFDVLCVVAKTTTVDALPPGLSGPVGAASAPALPAELRRRCYVYRIVDRQPRGAIRGPLLPADATVPLVGVSPISSSRTVACRASSGPRRRSYALQGCFAPLGCDAGVRPLVKRGTA